MLLTTLRSILLLLRAALVVGMATICSLVVFKLPAAQAQISPTQVGSAVTGTILISTEDFFARGTHKVLLRDYQGAVVDLNQAIQINPNDAKAYVNHGLVLSLLGDYQKAIADFDQALRLNAEDGVAYYNRGFIRAELEDYAGALADFNQALQINSEDADTCHCRGMVRYGLGDQQGAIADFRLAANLYLKQGKTSAYQGLLKQISKLTERPALPLL